MSENKKIEDEIDFVSRYYEDGSLMPRQGWHRFTLTHAMPKWRRNIAAACIGAVVLVASASVYYVMNTTSQTSTADEIIQIQEEVITSNPFKVVKIQFNDATLSEVVTEIEKVYGVKISNIPEEETRLTISYEGNAYDVVETINDLLGTNLNIDDTDLNTEEKGNQETTK